MDEQYLKAMHPVTAVLHWKILSILKQYDIKTVLDVGGTGKLRSLSQYDVSEANLKDGVDGCALPYEDGSFDAVVSIATLEHVHDQEKFLDECERVSRIVSMHWFPYGPVAEMAERMKKKYGHYHPCRIPYVEMIADKTIEGGYAWEEFMSYKEHMLLCMTLTPSLKTAEVYDSIVQNNNVPYGGILKRDE